MRRAIALWALLAPGLALAFSIPPPPPRFLHDGAHVLSSYDRQRIEQRLMELNQAGQQIGVAILPSLDGESVEDATLRIAEAWGPGQRKADNGALIAVFMADRKMRIEVGYGLEGRIPDSVARQIVMDRMRPAFRANRYGDGILEAVDSVAAAAMGQALPTSRRAPVIPLPGTSYRVNTRNSQQLSGCGCLCLLLIGFAVLRGIFRSIFRPRQYGWGRREVYRPHMPWWSWFLFGNAVGGWGRGHDHHHHRSSGWFGGSGGGGWGGGGGSFGGGSFGGGGASGSW